MPPIIVHQAKEYSQYIHFKVTLYCAVHHTPSVYMDKYMWLKSISQSSNVYGSSPVNYQILFFGWHDNYFDNRTLIHTEFQNIQPL